MADITAQLKRISKCRTRLLIEWPFWGHLALSLKPTPTAGLESGTLATDGYKLLFDPDGAINEWSDDELIGVIAHEVGHCAFGHLWRRENRNPMLWNIATDYAINWILDSEKLTLPKSVLLQKSGDFANKSAEYIYNKLKEQMQECEKCGSMSVTLGPPSSGSSGDDGSGEGEKNEKSGKKGKGKKGQNNQETDGEKGSSGCPVCDGHPYTLDDSSMWKETTGNKNRNDINEDGRTSEEQEKYWKEKLRNAAVAAKMQGNIPGYLSNLIDGFLEPKLSWKELLRDFIVTSYVNDYKLIPPNKRFLHIPMYMPRMRSNHLDLAICMDTSGSISDREAKQFLTEIKSIAESFESYSIHYMQCDYDISFYKELVKEDEDDWPMGINGRGGTSFIPPFNYLEDVLDVEPPLFIYLTDLMGSFPEPPNYPTLWVSTEDNIVPPFGDKIYIDIDY